MNDERDETRDEMRNKESYSRIIRQAGRQRLAGVTVAAVRRGNRKANDGC